MTTTIRVRTGLLLLGSALLLAGFSNCNPEPPVCADEVPCSHLNERGCAAAGDRCEPTRRVVDARPAADGREVGDVVFECLDREDRCEPVACEMWCEYGFARDRQTGCEICACTPPPRECPAVECYDDVWCEYGYATDRNGCQTCDCAPAPECRPVLCDLYCENGFKTDRRGCEICECADEPACPPLDDCPIDCELARGPDGCQICECFSDPHPPADCPDVTCTLYCEHGFKRNADGCEICECREARPPRR